MTDGRGNEIVPVPVSAVVTASFCPRRLFLVKRFESGWAQGAKYTICRQIASHLGKPLDGDTIWDEVLALEPDMNPLMRTFLDTCIARCNEGGPWSIPIMSDVQLFSRKYGLYGNVDKIFDVEPRFAIVRANEAPLSGVAGNDRLRIFGYMLLLSDAREINAKSGSVEYIPSGVSRPVSPNPIDKRRFLYALEKAREVLSGKEPKPSPGSQCRSCPSHTTCFPMGKRLSDIL